jgi:hypothetical protein
MKEIDVMGVDNKEKMFGLMTNREIEFFGWLIRKPNFSPWLIRNLPFLFQVSQMFHATAMKKVTQIACSTLCHAGVFVIYFQLLDIHVDFLANLSLVYNLSFRCKSHIYIFAFLRLRCF